VPTKGDLHSTCIEAPILVEVITVTTVDFRWTQSGTLVDRYTVSYTYTIRGTGCDSMVRRGNSVELGNRTRNYTLTGLEENSNYDIILTAIKGRRDVGIHILVSTNETGAVKPC
jgi:hypothetical protein